MSDDNYKIAPIPERLLKHQRVLIVTADKTHDLEFFYPYYRFSEEGYTVDVATPNGGEFKGKMGMGLKETLAVGNVSAADYSMLYIPGGNAPEELRKNDKVLALVKEFAKLGKPIAAICHGAQVLISADLVKDRRITAWPEVKGELEEAGGIFVDEALVEDGQFITGRKPGDLHRHLVGCMKYLDGAASTTARKAS